MFFWKVRTVAVAQGQQPKGKEKQSKENQEKPTTKALAETQPTVKKTCQIGIDRTVYKLLTKQRKQKRNMNQMEEDEKEAKVGWRGPREQPSEIPAKRRIFSKNNLVLTSLPSIQPIHTILTNMCGSGYTEIINLNVKLNAERKASMQTIKPSHSRKTGQNLSFF